MARYATHFLITIFFIQWLLIFTSGSEAYAQCTTPTGATISSSPALCPGLEKATVDTLTGEDPGEVYQYQLRYDSVSNTSVLYKVESRKVCGTGYSVPYVSESITVGTTTSLSIQQVIKLTKSSCSNGSFKVRATKGYNAGGYSYALVPSLNASEPVADYARPPQGNSVFSHEALSQYRCLKGACFLYNLHKRKAILEACKCLKANNEAGLFNVHNGVSELSISNLNGLAPRNYSFYFGNGGSFHHTKKLLSGHSMIPVNHIMYPMKKYSFYMTMAAALYIIIVAAVLIMVLFRSF